MKKKKNNIGNDLLGKGSILNKLSFDLSPMGTLFEMLPCTPLLIKKIRASIFWLLPLKAVILAQGRTWNFGYKYPGASKNSKGMNG